MKPNVIDWIVYRLFRWRWNRLFNTNPKLRRAFVECWNLWQDIESVEAMRLKDWTPEREAPDAR